MSTPTPARAVSPLQGIGLVAEREIMSKLQSRAFVISTLVLFALALVAVVAGGLTAKQSSDTPVAVTSDAASFVANVPGLDITEVTDRAAAERAVTDESVDAAVVADAASPTGFTVIAKTSAPDSLVMQLAAVPTVTLLEPDTTNPALRYIVSFGFGLLFLLAASTFGGTIASSVVEEKQTRIVEILISTVSTRTLLAGKVLGNTVLAIVQIVGMVAIAVVGLIVTGQTDVLTLLGSAMVWFAIFFLFGFILLAALFAAAASLVSRQEDLGSTITPVTMLVMAPYFLVIMFNDNPLVMTIMSYVPFSAPVGMPMRLFLGEAQWWEPLLSLLILVVSCVLAILVGARIYDHSILRMGGRVKLAEALKG
ncbi:MULTISPECIES: ABC transporter permease [Microbacterium]|uniref:ABC transporter permease n=1 Tax=Microbacterium TaxID=33882 RepID=UPI001E5ABF6B|nr:ABC transporter permease [Microbacterium nymphoidis]MCD2498572.1 ABC transporter permease [Microbacterium nymphoidis]